MRQKYNDKNKGRKYLQLYMCFCIYSLALVFSKMASQQTDLIYTAIYIFFEFVTLGLYAVIWQHMLKVFSLVVAMANKGSTVVFSLLWAVVIFHEEISLLNLIGSLLIVVGIGMVSWNE